MGRSDLGSGAPPGRAVQRPLNPALCVQSTFTLGYGPAMTPGAGLCGIGAVTGYGWGRERLWDGLSSGQPAGAWVPGHGSGGGPGWVVRVPAGGDPADGPSRFSRALRAAVREAVTDAR